MPEYLKVTLYALVWFGLCFFITEQILRIKEHSMKELCEAHSELAKEFRKMYHQVIKRRG